MNESKRLSRKYIYKGIRVAVHLTDGTRIAGLVLESGSSRLTILDAEGNKISMHPQIGVYGVYALNN